MFSKAFPSRGVKSELCGKGLTTWLGKSAIIVLSKFRTSMLFRMIGKQGPVCHRLVNEGPCVPDPIYTEKNCRKYL